jgi:hypothetical protein
MLIQDFAPNQTNKNLNSKKNFNLIETTTAALLFLAPVIILFLLSAS